MRHGMPTGRVCGYPTTGWPGASFRENLYVIHDELCAMFDESSIVQFS